ncbi:HlyD family secretion protein [Flavobacterium sp. HBTb2-11-1]|uniref:HlyD family secretion protein n=1 Tax=Flavobacterium sp. HBTb2-11-1 TaxID=2692212 RepID=UPI001371ABB2|nr:efflux RND transporter periplasmic adaptor subunit [Flavobacterium sp. HBTb2-11-1]MXO04554.1 HlyD family efflux transporter periplasmic adaptor subunit [Flavobacterium sp. HBTb2-11-1]
MKEIFKNYWALIIPIFVVIAGLIFFLKDNNEENNFIGMVDASSVDVAAEFPGRLDSLLVKQGDTVKTGQLLAVLRSNEINAIKAQALSAIDAAKGQQELLTQGARPELIEATSKLYQISQEQYKLFSNTYDRMERLYKEDVISGQEKDVFYFKFQAAKKEMETAQLNLQMLKNGTRPELLKTANAIVKQAEQAYELTKALGDNTRVYAPADGVISSLVTHQGEIISIGYPIMTIEKKNSTIIKFNIRQDKSNLLKVGSKVSVKVPGCEPETFSATVHSIAPTLEFANWVPSKDKGEFELRTFTIELKPENLSQIKGLRSGMTASLILP